MPAAKTIIIADDHPLMAEGIAAMIHRYTKYKVLSIAKNGKALLHLLNAQVPDLVLLDVNMPELNGMEAAGKIRQLFPQVKIVFISMYWELAVQHAIKKINAEGFIPKLTEGAVFLEALKKLMSGEKVYLTNSQPANGHKKADSNLQGKTKLSARELEIIQLIKKGLTSKDISARLHLSIYTVDTHRKNICRKLKISSPNALVKFVHENNL